MKMLAVLFFPFVAFSSLPLVDGVQLENEEKIQDVTVLSGEKNGSRLYHASFNTAFEGDFDKALEFVLNFPNRCNNSYRKERKLLAKDIDCIHHNDNLIESQIVKNLKNKVNDPSIVDQFVLKRRIWNKGLRSYNDFVTVKKVEPKENEKRALEVSYRMLSDEEAKSFITDPVPFDNAFYYTLGTYRMAETKDGKVEIDFSYVTKTDHWFLTSSMIQGSVYSSLASGARLAVDGIEGAIKGGK